MARGTRKTLGIPVLQISLLIAGCAMAAAGTVDTGSLNYVTLRHGSEMIVNFSIASYVLNNPGSSTYPTSLDFLIAGPNPVSAASGSIPGSSATWFTGYQLRGWLESPDGSASLALSDANANRLGMAPGSLVFTPGTFNGINIATASASRVLSLAESESIFEDGGNARIRLDNTGSDVTLGLGAGYTLRSAISEPNVRGPGPVTTAGVTQSVVVTQAPEPGTWVLIGVGLLGISLVARNRTSPLPTR